MKERISNVLVYVKGRKKERKKGRKENIQMK